MGDGAVKMPFRQKAPEPIRSPIVDPTAELLGEVTGLESRIPWAAVGITVLCLLWLPISGWGPARSTGRAPAPTPTGWRVFI